MKVVTVHAAKTALSQLLARVEAGEEIVLAPGQGADRQAVAIVTDLDAVVASQSFIALPVSIRHGQTGGTLPGPRRDPFDRRLIAQAVVDRLVLVSNEKIFDTYGIERLW
ncbi:MAG TPA: hypothetical protein VHD15_14195 [Hyphomicrobiales bacterium]|nr:hypothetical protein [Hyphomicrobiales bacterium]